MSRFSENEDDPEVYESSGDEWKQEEEEKKNNSRRLSQRLSKKPRKKVVEVGSSDEDSDEPIKKKSKNGVAKKVTPKKEESEEEEEDDEDDDSFSDTQEVPEKNDKSPDAKGVSNSVATVPSRGIHKKFIPRTIYSEDYATGSFVILKKDAQIGDPSKHPCIWRIDGKALLQKYEAFDDDDKVRHKNTSIYTGWSPMDKDLYAPVTVDVIQHSNQNLTVELHWDKLKTINIDSD